MILYSRLLLTTLLIFSFQSNASDLAKEKRWAEQVVDAILDGEAIWLNDKSNDFLGIYTQAEESSNRAVVVMHGTGVHPDWQQVVQPLRVTLTEHGWNTLSIQMPVLANEAEHEEYAPLYDEVAPRIDAAMKYLDAAGMEEIVLIGHSQGASMAAYYLATSKQDLRGFVAIGLSGEAKDIRMSGIRSIEKINIPMLDLYGDEDLEGILQTLKQRNAAAMKSGNKNYTQLKIEGNHFYDGNETGLVDAVSNWLVKLNP